MADYERFLYDLFEFKDPTHYIQIWLLKDRGTRRFTDIAEAMFFVEEHVDEDVYVCVGLTDEDLGLYRRGTESHIAALTGLVVEADFARVKSSKKGPLPSREESLEIIGAMPVEPSLITMSGHGYHAWWLFKEPYLIEDEAERETLKDLSTRWSGMFKALAQERGFVVDSVYDLTRVMRIPGTLNCKDEQNPVRAKIIERSRWRAAGLSDFERVVRDDLLAPQYVFEKDPEEIAGEDFTLNPAAEAPHDKRRNLEETFPEFRDTMHYDREDLEDQSPSGYDMSAATYAASAQWEPQEIANLLIELRRRHGRDTKIDRLDYYKRTIAKAMQFAERTEAEEQVPSVEREGGNAMRVIAKVLEKPIDRIVKTPAPDGAIYALEYEGVTHELGGIREIMSQTFFRRRWADIAGIIIEKHKGKWWDTFAQLLLDQCVIEDIGEEATLGGAMIARIEEYLSHHKPQSEGDIVSAIIQHEPFLLDETIAVTTEGVRRWLEVQGLDMSRQRIALSFRRAGFERKSYSYAQQGMNTSRSIWLLPDELAGRIMDSLEQNFSQMDRDYSDLVETW